MKCPYCSGPDSKVIDSRSGEENKVIRRRRECFVCHKRFSTYERIEPLPLMVIKNNGTREPFDHTKLRASLMRACEKRPISIDTIEKIVAEVEYAISNYVMEVPSKLVGEMVLEKLEKIDPVSYVRFASVYKGFQTVDDFVKIAELFRGKLAGKSPRFAEAAALAAHEVKKRSKPALEDAPATPTDESSSKVTQDRTISEHPVTESEKSPIKGNGELNNYPGGSNNADTDRRERVQESSQGDVVRERSS